MFCKKCGTKLNNNAKFCKRCGTLIRMSKNEKAEGVSPDTTDENRDKEKKETNKKKKYVFIKAAISFLTVVIVCFVLSYFFHVGIWIPKKNDATKTEIKENVEIGTLYEFNEDNVKHDDATGINYVNNILVVFFSDDTTKEDIENVISQLEGEIVGVIPVVNQYQIKVGEKTYEELVELCSILENYECVDFATIDQAVQLEEDVVPDDPWEKRLFVFGEKWSENNPEGSNWWQEAINSPTAWEYNDFFNKINIGIIDNGFDVLHGDLKGKIVKTTYNNVPEGHGTHVAGIIGAIPNNSCGITGIVWNTNIYTWDWELTKEQKKSKEEAYKSWNTTTQILAGTIDLIVSDGVKVINLSVGQTHSMKDMTREQEDIDWQGKSVSTYLAKLIEQGYDFVIVQSAGNGNNNNYAVDAVYNGLFCSVTEDNCVTLPTVSARDVIDRIIVVGAAQNDGKNNYSQASFSNGGNRVDICAPGKDIYSTVPGGYKIESGTSMAAPIVTGVAALVWSADSDLSGADVKRIVCSEENTKYTVADNTSKKHPLCDTYKLVNAELAVEAVIDSKLERMKNTAGELDENPIASLGDLEATPISYSGVVLYPEDVVLKMFDALHDGKYEDVAACLSPTAEQQIDFFGGLASDLVGIFSGEYISWGELLLEVLGTTDVEIIECNSYNYKYKDGMNDILVFFKQIPG